MWNPFKKQEAAPQDNPVVEAATLIEGTPRLMLLGSSRTFDQLPQNPELLAFLQVTRRDLAQGDWRPLWRALLSCELWVPVFDADLEGGDDRKVDAMVFQQETALYAFTDAERARIFFKDAMPVQGDTLNVALVDGQTLCDMAAHFEVERMVINPNFEDEWELLPLAFRVLARGVVPGGIGSDAPADVLPTKPIGGMPPHEPTQALRAVLAQHSASAAYWFINYREAEGEMHYAIGVDCAAEQWAGLGSQLASAWTASAPFPSPLFVFPLGDDAGQCAFIRQSCNPIYP